ncbi:uncharacterized protein [Ptychodera flava]|uniref:uncharacterized protein n=1 Tax=Ptychodera flava TaxID=63121 RepID=UPI00396A48DC
MPLFLDRISDPITAICVSVTAVLIFGEVLPQALCTRFGLAIGATLSPLVYFLMAILFIIAWPLAKVLDCLLGKDHGTFFRRAELGALVDLHTKKTEENEEPLSVDEVLIIKGALDMRNKMVKDAYTPLESVYMIDINSAMDHQLMDQLLAKGHSRIPVYEKSRSNVKGVLLVKTLIKLDPDDGTQVRDIFSKHSRKLLVVSENTPLYDLLNEFQTGKTHMVAVKKEVNRIEEHDGNVSGAVVQYEEEILGIITLEDIIEEILQEEILDETDVFIDVHKRITVAKARASRSFSQDPTRRHRLQKQSSPSPHSPTLLINAEIIDSSAMATDDQQPLLANEQSTNIQSATPEQMSRSCDGDTSVAINADVDVKTPLLDTDDQETVGQSQSQFTHTRYLWKMST